MSVYLHLQEKDYSDLPDPYNPRAPVVSARNAICDNEYVLNPIARSNKPAEHRTEKRGVSWEPDAMVNLERVNSEYVDSSGCGTSGYGSTSANSDLNVRFAGKCVLEMEVGTAGFQPCKEDSAMDSPKSVFLDRSTWPKTNPPAASSPKLTGPTRFHPQGEEEAAEEEDRKYVILDSPLSKGVDPSSTREDEGYLEISLSYEDLKVAGSNHVGGAKIGPCYDDNYIYT